MADIDELIPESAQQGVIDTRNNIKGLTEDLIPAIKNARDLANAIMSVNSNGALVKSFNEAAVAQNKANDALERGIKAKERAEAAELRLQQARDRAEANYQKQQAARAVADSKAGDEYQRRKDKEAIAAEKTAKAVTAAAAQEAKAAAELLNDYGQLSKAYNEAALRAKNYQLQIGAGNPVTVQAIKDANDLGNKLKALDASVGQNQRNVGNYPKFDALGNSIQQILREAPSAAVSLNTFFLAISNNLPMFFDQVKNINLAQKETNRLVQEQIVIAREAATAQALQAGATVEAAAAEGALAAATVEANAAQKAAPSLLSQIGKSLFSVNTLLTLAVLGLTLFGGKIIDAITGTKKLSEEQKEAIKQQEAFNKSVGSSVAALELVRAKIENGNAPLAERKKLVKELQDQYPSYFGSLSQEAILAGNVADAYNRATNAIIASAKTKLYSDKFGEDLGKLNDLQEKIDASLAKNKSKTVLDRGASIDPNLPGSIIVPDVNDLKGGKSLGVDKDDKDNTLDFIKQYNNLLIKLSGSLSNIKALQKDTLPIDEGKPPKKTPTARSYAGEGERAIEDQTKEIAEQKRLQAQIILDNLKQIADDEQKSLNVRLAALKQYYDKEVEMAGNDYAAEKDLQSKKAAYITEREDKARKEGKLTADLQKALNKERELSSERVNTAIAQHEKSLNDAALKFGKERIAILKQTSESVISRGQLTATEQLEVLSENQDAEEKLLIANRGKGKAAEQKYLIDLKNLKLKYAQDAIKIQVAILESEIDTGNLTREDYDKTIAKIEKLQTALNNLSEATDANKSSNIFGVADKDLASVGKYVNMAEDLYNTLERISDNYAAKRQAQLRKETEAIDRNADAEISKINQSKDAEEEKARRIAEVQAKAQIKKDILDEKERVKQRRDAERQKAVAVALAIIKGVLFVLGSSSIPEAILRGLTVAAEVAVAASTPIPAFAEGAGIDGKPAHKGGLALFGEAGKELVIEPGKTPYVVTRPTIAPLPEGTRVIPEHKITSQMYAMMSPHLVSNISSQKQDNSDITKRLDKWGQRQIEAMRENRPKRQVQSIFGSSNKEWLSNY